MFRIVVSPLIWPLSAVLLHLSASGIHFVALGVLLFPASVVLVVCRSVCSARLVCISFLLMLFVRLVEIGRNTSSAGCVVLARINSF